MLDDYAIEEAARALEQHYTGRQDAWARLPPSAQAIIRGGLTVAVQAYLAVLRKAEEG
jgi:hypothetical protein